jgi:hypothetical protein
MSGTDFHDSVTVHVPMTFRKRGGRKQVIAPDGHPSWAPPRARIDNTMVKALARAFRWRRMLETGAVTTVREIAAKEKINASYVCRVLRLTLLAPDTVEAIPDGRQSAEVTLPVLMQVFPAEWKRQRTTLSPVTNSHEEKQCHNIQRSTAFVSPDLENDTSHAVGRRGRGGWNFQRPRTE